MEFVYEALNKQGQPVTGKVTAENTAEANEKLRGAGVIVTKIEPVKTGAKTLYLLYICLIKGDNISWILHMKP